MLSGTPNGDDMKESSSAQGTRIGFSVASWIAVGAVLAACVGPTATASEEVSGAHESHTSGPVDTFTVLNQVDWLDNDRKLQGPFVPESEMPGEREDGSGAFRTHCIESHESYDDPLVKPGQPGAMHHHIFFGNPNTDAFTTSESLLSAETTTCDGVSVNKSAYWVPALYGESGKRITYVDPLFYYKTGYHLPADSITPPPRGLQIIAGLPMAQEPQDIQVAKFRCNRWEAQEPQFSIGDPLDHVPYIPECEQGDIVEMRLVFPQCWDGQNLTSPDHRSHMAYPSEAQAPVTGTGECPESHPVAIPEISYNFGIEVTEDTGPSSTWRFATDPPDAPQGGYSLHGDWMNGWDEETIADVVTNCLNPGLECMVGLLGNGEQLRPVPLDGESPPRVESPSSTGQPWEWNGFETFPSLYLAAEPEGRFSREQLAKLSRLELAILEFRMGQFMDEDGRGRWAKGDLGALMAQEVRRLKEFDPDGPPVLTYVSAEWAGAMYRDQRRLLNRRPSLFLRDARDCEGFIEYPLDINETGFESKADLCRWDFRKKKTQRTFVRVVKNAAEGGADGIFFDGGHTVGCDEASELSRMNPTQRGRFMDGQHKAFRSAFRYLADIGQYPVLSTTIGFERLQGQVPWGDDCPRSEEQMLADLDDVPFARNHEFWMWNLGELASRQILNSIEEGRRAVPTIVHMPYFPEDQGCLEGCFGTDGQRIRFTEQEFLEFGIAAFLVSMSPGSYFGFSDMQSDPEGGGWFDESWKFHEIYDDLVTGAPIGEVEVSEDAMMFRRQFENGSVMVNVAEGTYRLDFG
jgi:hypothetical protein